MIHAALWLLSATVVMFFVIMFGVLGISILAWLSLKWRWAYVLGFVSLCGISLYSALNRTNYANTQTNQFIDRNNIWFNGAATVYLCKGFTNECYNVTGYSDGKKLISIDIPNYGNYYLTDSHCGNSSCSFSDNGIFWTATKLY